MNAGERGRASDRGGLGVSRSGWEERRHGEAASLVESLKSKTTE